jgi:hypothetical protein
MEDSMEDKTEARQAIIAALLVLFTTRIFRASLPGFRETS